MTALPVLHDQPISNIQWVPVESLDANEYNPNHVLTPEFKLLRFSLLKQGWIQPILVARSPEDPDRLVVIDGFHRSTLAKTDKEVRAMTGGLVPVCIMEMSVPERMMLTVRINRAKGSHSALKMHELVQALVGDYGLPVEEVCEGIGASRHEIDTLLTESLFKRFDVDNTPYSKAWVPR